MNISAYPAFGAIQQTLAAQAALLPTAQKEGKSFLYCELSPLDHWKLEKK